MRRRQLRGQRGDVGGKAGTERGPGQQTPEDEARRPIRRSRWLVLASAIPAESWPTSTAGRRPERSPSDPRKISAPPPSPLAPRQRPAEILRWHAPCARDMRDGERHGGEIIAVDDHHQRTAGRSMRAACCAPRLQCPRPRPPHRRRLHPPPPARTHLTLLAVDPHVTFDHRGHYHGRGGDVRRLHRHAGPHAMPATITATPEPTGFPAAASSASWATTRSCPRPPAHRPSGDPADPPPRHRQRALDRQHREVCHSARDSGRLPGHDHADRRHRLSVGTVATMAAFIVSTQSKPGPAVASLRVRPGAPHRPRQRHRCRRLPRPSADHDARHQPDGTGCLQVYQRTVSPGTKVPPKLWPGVRHRPAWGIPNALLVFLARSPP